MPLFFDTALAAQFFKVFECNRLVKWFDGPEFLFRIFLAAVSHHGRPAFTTQDDGSLDCRNSVRFWRPTKDMDPMMGLRELFETAQRAFPRAFEDVSETIPLTETLQHRFAGLVMLADWLGSHSEAFFPFRHKGDRLEWSKHQARKALRSVGLDSRFFADSLRSQSWDFLSIFGFEPYPLQARLAESDLPPLLIAESETGSGKTEAALAHFFLLFASGKVDSLYFALPTRVAARQLYERVLAGMRRAFGDEFPPVLLAVPGYARIDGEPIFALPSEERLFCDPLHHRQERRWVAERPKRFLAAAVAVGTIDQALLSALRVGHAHLRRICLDRSLLVIDEVHSSDVYMRALSRRMISEHLKIGGRTLLLSATLGSAAREEYLNLDKISPAISFQEASVQPYPSLCGQGLPMEGVPNPKGRRKNVIIEPVPCLERIDLLLPRIEQAVCRGLRVMVVLNTVRRAVELFRLADALPGLKPSLFSCAGVSCPHHGRFARSDREVLDREVTLKLGKGSPSGPLLLIGTQTLEQSLDIDSDWLITDLCPLDVLLQRLGRLHRHDRGERPDATCTVLLPETQDLSIYLAPNGEVRRGVPAGLGTVYEDMRILQLSSDKLASGPIFQLPDDNRHLVESATHPERIASLQGESWLKHGQYIEGRILAMTMAADGAVIPEAHFGDFSFPSSLDTRLMTRLGLDDRRLHLGGSFPGPFGHDVEELDIPGHMAGGLEREEADAVVVTPEGLLIRAGGFTYLYSRVGLEKMDESAHR